MNTQKFFMLLFVVLTLGACSKDEVETVNEVVDTTNTTVLFEGDFESDAHTTSGKVSILKSSDGKIMLSIKDLKSDNGPDLRLYLADDKKATNLIEIIAKPKNGTYGLVVPEGIDFNKKRYVLIWCKQFSILFGSALLK